MRGEDVDVSASISRGRLVSKSPWRSLFDDYAVAAAFGLPAGVGFLLGAAERGHAHGGSVFLLVLLVFGGYLAWASYASYRLRVLTVNGDREAVMAQALEAMSALDWMVAYRDEHLVCAHTPISAFTWGQAITLIPRDGQLYFNSRNQTTRLVLQISFGRNASHYRKLRACLERIGDARARSILWPTTDPSEIDSVRTPENIGCALGLLPVIGFLVFLIVQALKDASGPPPAPAYPGEVIPSLGLGGLSVLAVFLSFFLAVFVKFAFGLAAGRGVSILSMPLTLAFFALFALVVRATGVFVEHTNTLWLMAGIAGASSLILELRSRHSS